MAVHNNEVTYVGLFFTGGICLLFAGGPAFRLDNLLWRKASSSLALCRRLWRINTVDITIIARTELAITQPKTIGFCQFNSVKMVVV